VVTVLVVWTLALAAAIVLVLAAHLIAIASYLYRAGGSGRSHLAKLAVGLAAVRDNAAPLERRMAEVARALVALRGDLQAVDEYLAEAVQTVRR
jgi:hypothetical protein